MNEKQRDSEPALRALILDTARNLLTTKGYHHLSMRRIAGQIGYSATSIYLHFDNRDQLVHALIDQGVDRLYERLSGVVSGEDAGERAGPQAGEHAERQAGDSQTVSSAGNRTIDRLLRLCRAYVHFGLENPEYYEIMYILHPEYMARYPADKYRKARRNLMILADALEEGMESGLFEPSDPLTAATVVWAQLHGTVSLLNSRRVDRRVDEEQLIDEACRRIIRGFHSARERPESPAVSQSVGVEQ